MKHICTFVLAGLLTVACSDTLFDDNAGVGSQEDGIPFGVSTVEMGQQLVDVGGGQVATATRSADGIGEHLLEGGNAYGLKVHRLPLPLMGIHPGTVRESAKARPTQGPTLTQGLTRAGANEVVNKEGTNFHDSLTIWGYTSNGTELFDQILLTKVRNWRNSVEWPYGQGANMKFYAVAPSLETINMLGVGGTYSAPPMLTYTLPEAADEMRDVLYGESENISIASGPAGTTTNNPKQEHLGKDNKFVELQFRHITTAIRFSQGTVPSGLTINSVGVQGIYSKGDFDPSRDDPQTATKGVWTNQSTAASYTLSSVSVTEDENVYIDGGKVLFMIPQTLPDGARLVVTLTETKTKDGGGVESKEHTISCSIKDDIWKKGYTVNYKITVGELEEGYYLTTDPVSEIEHSNNPVNGSLNVHSYHLYSDYSTGSKVDAYRPVTWKVAGYSTDEAENKEFKDTRPTWLTDFHGVLTGSEYVGGNDATASFTLARQELAKSTSHDVVLSENSKDHTASSLDLSWYYPYTDCTSETTKNLTKYKTQTPANCYIVNRIGTYSFPLYYGNMTENVDQAACFKDHLGNKITKFQIKEQIGAKNPQNEIEDDAVSDDIPYLWILETTGYKTKYLPTTVRAKLVWQDVNGLVTSVGLASGNISFSIRQSVPGNAVIALQARKVSFDGTFGAIDSSSKVHYDDSETAWETLWTWHIWMTDEVYRNDGREDEVYYDTYYVNGASLNEKADHIAQLKDAGGNNTDKILPVNLGWVPDEMDFGLYEPRSVWVKLQQTEPEGDDDKKTTTVEIKQHARQQLYTGMGTVYQWGRPTAFPAFRTLSGAIRPIYDIDGNDITSRFVMAQATSGADAIANPYQVLQWETNPDAWFDISSGDYANAMWNSTEKTVYDPCPPGFRVPPVSIFTGFSKTGGTVVNVANQLNMWQETNDLNGVTQKNGERQKGGYFYCKPNETDRYGAMVYMPATGEFHGNKTVGALMTDAAYQLNQINGIYWTSDYSNDATSKACFLWITPEQSYSAGTAEKPVMGFFGTSDKQNYYGSVRSIRPMKIE
ncbi:MAG: hypothetical protein IJ533_04530 [Prevotella sp.]|nr:hypothetical protein [Prevotella sp.]